MSSALHADRVADMERWVIGQWMHFVLTDEVWRAFGFSKRPRRGALFEFLVPRSRVRYESYVIREASIVFLTLVRCATATSSHPQIATQVQDDCVSLLANERPLWQAFRFESSHQARTYIAKGLEDYAARLTAGVEFATAINGTCYKRYLALQADRVVDEKFRGKAVVGMIQLSIQFGAMTSAIRRRLDES
ncbi:MAG: hypothetical protein K8S98_17295 [Planctomycetes bacterium]|nr:hypothetical protein [Planctomycetota bacterium]